MTDDRSSVPTHRSGPLTGVRVLDASTMLAGPYTAGLLADFGADVIKVEDPRGGDPMRYLSPNEKGQSILSKISNRNKRSIALDLRRAEGQDLFRQLAAHVDVVSTNFRMATLERWGLDYPGLARDHESLIMYHLSAIAHSGPRRDDPGFARVAEAYSGLTYASGTQDGPPMFSGYALADGVGGIHGAFAIVLALYEAQRSGRGQLVQVSLADAMIRMLEGFFAEYEGTGRPPTRTGNENGIVPNGIYRTADDRWIVLPVSTPNMWTRLCTVLGREGLADDPRFRTNDDRVRHRAALDEIIAAEVAARTFEELWRTLRGAEVAVGAVNSVADLFADDSAWEHGSLLRVEDPRLGRAVAMPGIVPRLSATPGRVRHVGPEAGDDTEEVLRDVLGLSEDQIAALERAGTIASTRTG